jgi:hypothetical protein
VLVTLERKQNVSCKQAESTELQTGDGSVRHISFHIHWDMFIISMQ